MRNHFLFFISSEGGTKMKQEGIPVTEIPKFQTCSEEFFLINWYKEMFSNPFILDIHRSTNKNH